jgi:hypothetical protein
MPATQRSSSNARTRTAEPMRMIGTSPRWMRRYMVAREIDSRWAASSMRSSNGSWSEGCVIRRVCNLLVEYCPILRHPIDKVKAFTMMYT